jgi:class 3 adenylate cyclase
MATSSNPPVTVSSPYSGHRLRTRTILNALYTPLSGFGIRLRRYADNLRVEGRAPLQIRIGVNAGELVVRSIRLGEAKSEYTPIGHTANLVARMGALANPGSIQNHMRP